MSKEHVVKDSVEKSNIVVDPFTTKYLDEEREETGSELITLRINPDERELINYIKLHLHYTSDSKAIKSALPVLKNVIQHTFGEDLIDKLCAEGRRRPTKKDLIK